MRHCLLKYLCKQWIGEFQSVNTQIIVNILRYIKTHHPTVLCLYIIIYYSVAMTYYHFYKHTLHLRRLLQWCCLADSGLRSLNALLLLCGTCLFRGALLTVVAYETVECVDERSLVQSHTH